MRPVKNLLIGWPSDISRNAPSGGIAEVVSACNGDPKAMNKLSNLAAVAAVVFVASCAGAQDHPPGVYPRAASPVDTAVSNYAQALFDSDNATIALYRPHLRQSDIDECRGREDLVDVMQPVKRNMVFKDCLSAAASRNQGR